MNYLPLLLLGACAHNTLHFDEDPPPYITCGDLTLILENHSKTEAWYLPIHDDDEHEFFALCERPTLDRVGQLGINCDSFVSHRPHITLHCVSHYDIL